MNEWVPLFGALVTAAGVLGVAFWNGRGESKDVRQLKAMNDVIEGLPEDSDATRAFVDARDGLLLRVAAGIASLPRRRRIVWLVIGIVAAAGVLVWVGTILAPLISVQASEAISVIAAAAVAVAGLLGGVFSLQMSRRSQKEAEKDIEELVELFNRARAEGRNSVLHRSQPRED